MTARGSRAVGTWLLILAAMTFGMVIGGGHVRTVDAGFVVQTWHPFTGIVPPLTHAAWERAFALYRATGQFRALHPAMTLSRFKPLYLASFLDRDWGRVIALAFLVPFAVFWARGLLSRRLALWLAAIFAAGALQAVMGWVMTYEGTTLALTDPAPVLVAAHLVLAMLILIALLWTGMTLRNPEPAPIAGQTGLRALLTTSVALIVVTMGLGALVAATGALHVYNTFPLMDGHALPPHALKLHPLWLNFLANKATVQFDHRVLATITAIIVLAAAVLGLRAPLGPKARDLFLLLAGLVSLQYILGMTALVSGMGEIGYLHELNAVLLLAACVACRHALRGAGPTREANLVMKAAE